jgi:HlyD family secretion protein
LTLAALCKFAWIAAIAPFCAPPQEAYVGYVEGEYVSIAPIDVARIDSESVRRGDVLKAGDPIARLETDDAEIALRNAEAALAQAKSDLADLQKGRRPEEIAAMEASLQGAQSSADDAGRTYQRRQNLLDRGYASQADFDAAKTAYDVAAQRVRELTADLAVAKLPARADQIDSSEAKVKQAQAARDTAKWRLGQRSLVAPSAGYVSDIIRRVGDVAGPTAPVVSFLPDGAVKLKIYVPEARLAGLSIGEPVEARCDGCPSGLSADITYIAREPEFTPPVIYSLQSRQTLVYLVEARARHGELRGLQPGQIIDVSFTAPRP